MCNKLLITLTYIGELSILGISLEDLVRRALFFIAVFVAALVIQHVLLRGLKRIFQRANIPTASILLNIVRIVIWAAALLAVLRPVFGIEPTLLLAALGVFSVAISLGMQDTMANLVGGLILMLTRNVRPGDEIEVTAQRGYVHDIGWRDTTIKTEQGNTVIVPNSVITKNTVVRMRSQNQAKRQAELLKLQFVVALPCNLDEVKRTLVERAQSLTGVDRHAICVQLSAVSTTQAHINLRISLYREEKTKRASYEEKLLAWFANPEGNSYPWFVEASRID